MPLQLVRDAIEKARAREPIVHAMALLTGSRVLAYMDLPAAAYAFAEGVKELGRVPLPEITRALVHRYAIELGIPANPELAVELYRSTDFSHHSAIDSSLLINGLVANGQFPLALELVEDFRYPAQTTDWLLRAAPDDATQQRLLHAGMARWRRPQDWPDNVPRMDQFYGLFARYHKVLPAELAGAWLDEMLQRVLPLESERISVRYGENVHFESFREAYLFELLGALRSLKPPFFVEDLLHQFPSVAAGAQIYPLGLDSLMAQAAASGPRPLPSTFPTRNLEIPHLLSEAHHLYLEDLQSNNAAPHIFWPSAYGYSLALYHAGRQEGMAGTKHLDEIPDSDLIPRAMINLTAGLLRLDQSSGPQIFQPADK